MQRRSWRRRAAALTVGLLAAGVAACSSDDGGDGDARSSTTPPGAEGTSTTARAATSTTAPSSSTTGAAAGTPAPTSAPRSTTVTAAPPATVASPAAEWPTVDAETAGLDPAELDRLATRAEAAGSTCTAIVRNGQLVEARSWGPLAADEPREAWSVTKSVTSTLIGIAQDQGLLTVDDRVSTYVPEWRGTPSEEVTIRDILSNDSGRQWDADTDYVQMAFTADDKTAFAIALGQDAPPGEIWAYNNSAIQVLEAVLEVATGESPVSYAERVLFEPIGMAHTHLTTDRAGNAQLYAGMRTTCTDLARFGYLMLQGGDWYGRRIVSADYVAQATGESSTELNAAYGWLWWLNHRGPLGSAQIATSGPAENGVVEAQLLPDHSTDTFWALGLFEQIVAVIPTEDIVAVRMGDQPPDAAPFGVAQFTSGVLDAVIEHHPS